MISAEAVWIGWLVLFLICELVAAYQKKRGTLSETVWDWFGLRRKVKWGPARRVVLFAFMQALTFHLVFGTTVMWVALFGFLMGVVIVYSVLKDPKVAVMVLVASLAMPSCVLTHIPWPLPTPTPTPAPSPTPEPTPCPTPPPNGCWESPDGCTWQTCQPTPDPTPTPAIHAPLIADEELTLQAPQDGRKLTWDATSAAINCWRAKNPSKWRADGACLIDGPAGIDAAFQGISDELLAAGVIAGQSITKDGQRSDCIFVNRTGTLIYEESHLFDYGRACVATGTGAIKGNYVRTGDSEPVPQPTPDPTPLPTPEPQPTPTPVVKPYGPPDPLDPHFAVLWPCARWTVTIYNPRQMIYDSVFKFWICYTDPSDKPLSREYCDAAGFTNRSECPFRPDSPERLVVQDYVIGKPLWKSDKPLTFPIEHEGKPNFYMPQCAGCSYLEVCFADGSHCSGNVVK